MRPLARRTYVTSLMIVPFIYVDFGLTIANLVVVKSLRMFLGFAAAVLFAMVLRGIFFVRMGCHEMLLSAVLISLPCLHCNMQTRLRNAFVLRFTKINDGCSPRSITSEWMKARMRFRLGFERRAVHNGIHGFSRTRRIPMSWLAPKPSLAEEDVNKSLRLLMFDGSASTVMGSLTGGAFLVTFALLLGASNLAIGFIAAAAPLSQIMQVPAILLIEKFRQRKRIVVLTSGLARFSLIFCALVPWFLPEHYRLMGFVVGLYFYNAMSSISGCAWNSWMHDVIPHDILGRFFGKRLAVSTGLAALLSLAAGVWIDKSLLPGYRLATYSCLFTLGSLFGLLSSLALSMMAEPQMGQYPKVHLLPLLKEPFSDRNYRRLIVFLAVWNFAANLAAPFYTVYMIKELNMSLGWIIGLSVLSQLINVGFFRIWGVLADRFSNKSCLTVAGPLFIIGIGLWPFLTLPDKHVLTVPLLILIHILSGISTAGVTLCSGNIALKAAPKGKATVFLATNSLTNGAAASIAPVIAGYLSDVFKPEELKLDFVWHSTAINADRFHFSALSFQGTDFVFVLAFLVGLYAIHRLLAVSESGSVSERIVITELYQETRHALRSVANVGGIRHMTYFPYAVLIRAVHQSRKGIGHIKRKVRRPPKAARTS